MNLTHVTGPYYGGLNVVYDNTVPSLPIKVRERLKDKTVLTSVSPSKGGMKNY